MIRPRALAVVALMALAAPAWADGFQPPVLTGPVRAAYPPEAAKAGLEGTVILELLVDETGRVVGAKVVGPAGHGFDEAALAAARQFHFSPGRSDGKPVPVKITYRYRFVLEKKPVAAKKPVEKPVRLEGSVSERGTRTPLSGVAVIVLDAGGQPLASVDTAEGGAFALRLPPDLAGPVKVVIAAPGYKTLQIKEKLKPREKLTVKYALRRSSYALYESTVRSEPARVEVSRVSLSGDEVRRIPGTRGDALQAVLNLPSVARSPFDLGQLVIRGSAPGESGAFLLGMQIPQAFHFVLGTSTFNSYLLERFDLIPSNFSVRYGRLTGGLVDIVPREGRRDRFHGDIKIDLMDAHIIVEGPVTKKKGSFALSLRRSYADAILGAVLPSAGFTVAPRYWDYQGLFDYPLGGGHIKLVLFGSDDELAFVQKTPPDSDASLVGAFGTRMWFHTLIATYTKKWRRTELEASLQVGGQHQDATLGQAAQFNLDLVQMDARLEARHKLTPRLQLTAGLDVQTDYYWVSVDAPSPATEEVPQPPISLLDKKQLANQGYEGYPAVYVQADWKPFDRLEVIPGVRVDWFNNKSGTFVQPRLMARFRIADETWLKAGAGLFYMPPLAPYDNPVLGNPAVRPEQAVHVTMGIETRPIPRFRALSLEVNGFYKDLRYLAVSSSNFLLRDGKVVPEVYSDEGYGRVYGADFLLKNDSGKYVYGWIAYTLVKSERQDHPGEPFRPFQYDQTNILTLILGYHLPLDFDVGVRFRYVTGNPDTSELASALTIYDADRDTYYPQPGAPYATRLPDFVQLDLRIDKRFIFKTWILGAYLDISNITNQANVEGWAYSYDYTRRAAITGLPILPSIGLRASF